MTKKLLNKPKYFYSKKNIIANYSFGLLGMKRVWLLESLLAYISTRNSSLCGKVVSSFSWCR